MIGGYNKTYFENPDQVQFNWQKNRSAPDDGWYVLVKNLLYGGEYVQYKEDGSFLGAYLSFQEEGIVIKQEHFAGLALTL